MIDRPEVLAVLQRARVALGAESILAVLELERHAARDQCLARMILEGTVRAQLRPGADGSGGLDDLEFEGMVSRAP